MVGLGAKGARRTLISIGTSSDLIATPSEHHPKKRLTSMLVEVAQSGTKNLTSETHFAFAGQGQSLRQNSLRRPLASALTH